LYCIIFFVILYYIVFLMRKINCMCKLWKKW